jgi:hypothetical protein
MDPRQVAAVAVASWPRRAVAAITRSGVVAAVPRSVAPWSRGRAKEGPLCGQATASPRPRGGGTSKAGEQAAPLDVRVAMAMHGARGSSGVMEGASARNDDRAWHPPIRRSSGGPSNDLHMCLYRRRRPPATTSSDSCFLFDYCVLCLPHVLFTLKMYDCMLEHGVRISVYCMHIFCIHIVKTIPWFMMFVITIKIQIKSFMFVNVRFVRLP